MPVKILPRVNARRFILRYDPQNKGARVTVPQKYHQEDLVCFLTSHKQWLEQQNRVHKEDKQESTFLFKGIQPEINWVSGRGTQAYFDDQRKTIMLCCLAHLKEKTLERFLKETARQEFHRLVQEKTNQAGLVYKDIRLKDTTSRWGSCSSKGNLNFSWRVIMAPPVVMDYLVAHEVAHLRHMDHSKDFWTLCGNLSENMTFGKQWLKTRGRTLGQIDFSKALSVVK